MKSIILNLAYVVSSASAARFPTRDTAMDPPHLFGAVGFLKPGSFDTQLSDEKEVLSKQLFEDAGRNPNATSAVSFNFAPKSLPGNSTWTWRVNITDINVPERIFNKPDQHVVNNQWELQWLGDETEISSMNSSSSSDKSDRTMCISAAEILAPSNITKRYTGSGDCSSVLGKECYEKLLAATRSIGCATPPDFLNSGIDECRDTLISRPGSGTSSTTFGNTSDFISSQPGNVVYYDTSPTVQAGNVSDIYDEAEGQLNILLLRENSGASAAMVCQVVNKKVTSSGDRLGLSGQALPLVIAISSALILF